MRVLRSTAAVIVVAVALAACSGDPKPEPSAPPGGPAPAPPPASASAPAEPPGQSADGFYIGSRYEPVRIRTEVLRVERFEKYSMLRMAFTSLEPRRISSLFLFGAWLLDDGLGGFKLVDPVGRKYYPALRKGATESGKTFGAKQDKLEPGVRYTGEVYFAPLPAGTSAVTVVNSGNSPGLYAGVPVVDGTTPPVPVPRPTGTPAASQTVELPSDVPEGETWERVYDLYGIAQGAERETASSSTEERVGLRTDVLFDFDKATLTPKATAVLDQIAQETRAKADPAKPPVRIVGHTDSKGDGAYNQRLSLRRAQTIRDELGKRLGSGFRYEVEGKGEAQRVAKEGGADDAQARARNRRVEISYRLKQTTTTTSATEAPGPEGTVAGVAGPPAAPHPEPEFFTERSATVSGIGYKLRVAKFYRDGAFLVAPIELVRDRKLSAVQLVTGLFGSHRLGCLGRYTDFAAVDPATRTTYLTVRIARPARTETRTFPHCLDGPSGGDRPGVEIRSFLYLTAPPAGVSALTFDAGPFGRIPDVPIT